MAPSPQHTHLKKFREKSALLSQGKSSNIILNSLAKHFTPLIAEGNPNVLDIGCGTGDVLYHIHKINQKCKLTGSDIKRYKVGDYYQFIQQDFNEELSADFSTYDVIIASEVVEHLENGRDFIRKCRSLLNPQGALVLSTPNIESLTSYASFILRGYFTHFGPRDYPAHIVPYSFFSLEKIIREVNLNLISVDYISNGRIPFSAHPWRRFFPFLKGRLFSDNYILVAKNG